MLGRPRRIALLGLLAGALWAAGGLPARASTVLRTEELDGLVAESEGAFLGRITKVRQGFDEHRLHSTWVTVEVLDPVWGEGLPAAGGSYTFKMYGAAEPLEDGSRVFIDGTPRFAPGQRFLLLLLRESEWGFRGTAGLDQGAFRVRAGADGELLARSLAGNRSVLGETGLARWLDADEVAPRERSFLALTRGPVPYSLLRRALVRIRHAAREGGR